MTADSPTDSAPVSQRGGWNTEDWWSVGIALVILGGAFASVGLGRPADVDQRLEAWFAAEAKLDQLIGAGKATKAERRQAEAAVGDAKKKVAPNPLSAWMGKTSSWKNDPRLAFVDSKGRSTIVGLLALFAGMGCLFGIGAWFLGRRLDHFLPGFALLSLLAVVAQVLADQELIKHFGLEYALWALVVGLIISNTVGTPTHLMAAVNTEFYIKTGLVLLGAEVLFHRLLTLGVPGIFVSWVVTPIVLISTYAFGQKVLKMSSPSLNMVISADMSVCGVSAAIATAAACRAKKEELSLAIGLSLAFTVIMMIVMPAVIRATGMSSVLGGAWIGGTIDSTGAVAAAGGMLDNTALQVAAAVKMIQNILIGAVAFGVAVYWVTCVERTPDAPRPRLSEIWRRFPRFILGFIGTSLLCSILSAESRWGDAVASAVIDGTSKTVRGWCFCLAFVSIGLETNFRVLAQYFAGGKPLVLYVCGQALNLVLTLFMAWLMFEKVFPHAADSLTR